MLRKVFESSKEFNSFDLPFLDKYAKEVGHENTVEKVYYIQIASNGLLIVTYKYKATIYERQATLYSQILEALNAFVDMKKPVPLFYCQASSAGKPELLQDDSETCWKWNKVETKYIQVCRGPGYEESKKETQENPFLSFLKEEKTVQEDPTKKRRGAN